MSSDDDTPAADILIVGASARAAAQSAANAGFRVVASDLFADRDLQTIAECHQVVQYPDDFSRIQKLVQSSHPGIPLMYTGAIENHAALIEQLGQSGAVYGNTASVVRAVRDPFRLEKVLSDHSIPFPVTTRERPDHYRHGWLRKAFCSAGGQRVDPLADQQQSDGYYYQQFIEGPACSAAYIASRGCVQVIGVSDMLVGYPWLGASGFTYCGSLNRLAEEHELSQWRMIGEVIANKFDLIGAFGIDAIVRGRTVIPIEVNPRYTASIEIYELADQRSAVREHVNACLGETLRKRDLSKAHVGKAILFATQDLDFPQLLVRPPDVQLADIPVAGPVVSGHPILTVVAQDDCREDTLAKLKGAAQMVYSQLETGVRVVEGLGSVEQT